MKRAVVVAIVSSLIAIVAACKRGGPHTCAKDSEAGCACLSETFSLLASQKVVTECGPAELKPSCAPAGMRSAKTCDGLKWKSKT